MIIQNTHNHKPIIKYLMLSSMTLILTITATLSTLYISSAVQADALADIAFLKFYGGYNEPDSSKNSFASGGQTNALYGLEVNQEIIGGDYDYDSGGFYGVAIEYFFADHWAVELAAEKHTNDLNHVEFTISDTVADTQAVRRFQGDELESTLYAINFYYDFGPIGKTKVQPYIGLGYIEADEMEISINNQTYREDGVSGTQYMVGFMRQLPSNWNLFMDVRFLEMNDVDLKNSSAGTVNNVSYETTILVLGISLEF